MAVLRAFGYVLLAAMCIGAVIGTAYAMVPLVLLLGFVTVIFVLSHWIKLYKEDKKREEEGTD